MSQRLSQDPAQGQGLRWEAVLTPEAPRPRQARVPLLPAPAGARGLAAAVLVALVVGHGPTSAGFSGAPRCRGQIATVVGTRRSEVLAGTPGRDVIQGLRGGDVVRGRRGNDLLCGGAGPDKVYGGRGVDRADGGPGEDFIQVIDGRGRDRADGGPGEDGCAIDVADRYRDCEAVVA
jgi:hypothetical protein